MTTAAIMMIAYLVLTTAIGLYLYKTNKSVQEYFIAKRGLGVALIIPLLFAETIAGAGTVGNAAEAFKVGISAVWANWIYVGGYLAYVIFTLKFFRVLGTKMGIISVPEAYELMFDRKTRLLIMVLMCLALGIIFAVQPAAAGGILGPMFKISTTTAGWIAGIIFIIVTCTGGLRGVAWMNVVHSLAMYLGMGIVAWFALSHIGGYSQLSATLPAQMFDFIQPDGWTVTAWVLGTAVTCLTSPVLTAVCLGADSLKTARNGIIVGTLLIIPFAFLPALIGMAAKAHLPATAGKTALFSMAAHTGPWAAGLASMAIIAAIFSTAPALLLLIVTSLTRDFYKIFKPEANDAEQLRFSQISAVLVGVLATFLGMKASSILMQIYGALQIRSVANVVLLLALWWPRINATAAFWSILFGGTIAAVWHFAGSPYGIAPLWPSLAVGLPVLAVLTAIYNKEPVSAGYQKYREALHEFEAEESQGNPVSC